MSVKLSIITINRNNAEGLRRTLASVAAQTCHEFEHVIIDGGSTDESVDIIRDYEHSVISSQKSAYHIIWVSEPDKGIYDAMNKGIGKASGEYCLFLNSGDYLSANDVLEKLNFSSWQEDIVGGVAQVMSVGEQIAPPKELTIRNLLQYGNISHQACFIKKDLFNMLGTYSTDLQILSDYEFMLKCALHDCSYKRIETLISIVEPGGVSDTEVKRMDDEMKTILDRVIPHSVRDDYNYWLNKNTYSNPAFIWMINNKWMRRLMRKMYKWFAK